MPQNPNPLVAAEADTKMLIVIAGPTAVGKTGLAIQIARHFNTEVVSADSRQIFKEMTIGTAKPSQAELNTVKHYFIDSHSIRDQYDAAQYGRDALAVVHKILTIHSHAVLCGGSGLYIKAVCEGFDDIPDVPPEIRTELIQSFETNGIAWLQQKMLELDPDHLKNIDRQNPHRLIRALEVKIFTGQSISSFRKKTKRSHPFQIRKIGLELPKEELYKRIGDRMDQMINEGLFDEARSLYLYRDHNALQTVGYQEIFDYMDGKYDYDEAVRLLKRNSRHYAKRQMTWFKRDSEIKWFHPSEIDLILKYIQTA